MKFNLRTSKYSEKLSGLELNKNLEIEDFGNVTMSEDSATSNSTLILDDNIFSHNQKVKNNDKSKNKKLKYNSQVNTGPGSFDLNTENRGNKEKFEIIKKLKSDFFPTSVNIVNNNQNTNKFCDINISPKSKISSNFNKTALLNLNRNGSKSKKVLNETKDNLNIKNQEFIKSIEKQMFNEHLQTLKEEINKLNLKKAPEILELKNNSLTNIKSKAELFMVRKKLIKQPVYFELNSKRSLVKNENQIKNNIFGQHSKKLLLKNKKKDQQSFEKLVSKLNITSIKSASNKKLKEIFSLSPDCKNLDNLKNNLRKIKKVVNCNSSTINSENEYINSNCKIKNTAKNSVIDAKNPNKGKVRIQEVCYQPVLKGDWNIDKIENFYHKSNLIRDHVINNLVSTNKKNNTSHVLPLKRMSLGPKKIFEQMLYVK